IDGSRGSSHHRGPNARPTLQAHVRFSCSAIEATENSSLSAHRITSGRIEGAMKAVCWMGTHDIAVENVPDPTILNPRDAIVRITSTAICGSDLHLYNGYMP